MKTLSRKIKVEGQFRPKTQARPEKKVPSLRLAGEWLERAGFRPGDAVTVSIDDGGTLTIKLEGASK